MAVQDETPSQFELRAFKAQKDGYTSIEASEDLLQYYNREGLGDSPYFDYRGMRVYKAGTKEATESKEKLQLHQQKFGDKYFFENAQ